MNANKNTALRHAIERKLGVPIRRGWHDDGARRFGWAAVHADRVRFLGATLEAAASTIAIGGAR